METYRSTSSRKPEPPPPPPRINKILCIALIVAIWAIGIAVGMHALLAYETTPGKAAKPNPFWPRGISLVRPSDRPTLVMTLHPDCPCSRATVGELEILVAHCREPLTAYVLIERLPGVDGDPQATDLWKSAAKIPGVTVISDDMGALCSEFRAETSGQVFFYDAAGALRFSGGMTDSRGHVGDNDGFTALEFLMHTGVSMRATAPVYGCPLH
jgi:hypothetical protein